MKIKESVKKVWENHKDVIVVSASIVTVAGAFVAGAAANRKYIENNWRGLFQVKPELIDIINDARIEYIKSMVDDRS